MRASYIAADHIDDDNVRKLPYKLYVMSNDRNTLIMYRCRTSSDRAFCPERHGSSETVPEGLLLGGDVPELWRQLGPRSARKGPKRADTRRLCLMV